ncbi:PDR/VanB family oxidoreductase [Pseudomonas wenzhouensis]|nr:PDR/VanB family oxidoreductase [Pseudomonas wenzhouensis]MDM9653251.1 PDR/VanB family oxidoreductase [Pseudomonas wenzhouensis]
MELSLKVMSVEQATPRIRVYSMANADGGPLPAFTAGAHLEFKLPVRTGRIEKRSYSIASHPADRDRYLFGVLYEANSTGGSSYMHELVREGTVLEAVGPTNNFPLAEEAVGEHVLIAGGIGITPLLSMARVLAAGYARYELHYCARTAEDMAFREEVAQVCGDAAHLYFDSGDASRGLNVHQLLQSFQPGRHVYVCGPRGLIEAVRRVCVDAGWPEDHVHYEFFGAEVDTSGGEAIEVVLAQSQVVLTIEPGQSILDAILDAGVDADFDCKRGECGVCVAKVVEGTPVHRDVYLSARERAAGDCMCTCVSWAESKKLVLDL